MCNCRSYNLEVGEIEEVVMAPPFNLGDGRKTVCIDSCIVGQIQALWDAGVVTKGCCCGHNGIVGRDVIVERDHAKLAHVTLAGFPSPLQVRYWGLIDEDGE